MVSAIEQIPPKYRLSVALVLLDKVLPLWEIYYNRPKTDDEPDVVWSYANIPSDLVSNAVILGKHKVTMQTMFQRILFISRWKYVKDQICPSITALQNENLIVSNTIEQMLWIVFALLEGMNIKHKESVSALYLLESIQSSIWLLTEHKLESEDEILEILRRGIGL